MRKLVVAFMVVLAQATQLHAQPAPLTLNTYAGPPLSLPDQSGYYDRILHEAFRRVGVAVIIGHLPAERSLLNANSGIDDGDFVRIAGLEKKYPNLVMVPEKLDDFEFVAFTRHLKLARVDWTALQPYAVGIVRGWKILEENLAGVRELTMAKNQEQLFSLLKQGRIDVAVYARKEGYVLAQQLGIADAVMLSPPLAVRPMHLYLHKKHNALVDPLAMALRTMKADGTYATFGRQALPRSLAKEAPRALP